MMMSEPRTFTALRGTLAHDVPLARYTSWRCGGPGERVYVPADRQDLATFVGQLPPDEPLTAIDQTTRYRLAGVLADRLAADGAGLLLASHDVRLVEQLTRTVHVLAEGRLVEHGPLRETLTSDPPGGRRDAGDSRGALPRDLDPGERPDAGGALADDGTFDADLVGPA